MAKRGRPSKYSDEIAREICVQLALGRPLTKIVKDDGMPTLATVYLWLDTRPGFSDRYARAREDQADTLADEIIEISDDGKNDTYDVDGAKMVNHDVIARSRLRVDARKWVASKLKPKKYGDLVRNEHSGADGGPIIIQASSLDENL